MLYTDSIIYIVAAFNKNDVTDTLFYTHAHEIKAIA